MDARVRLTSIPKGTAVFPDRTTAPPSTDAIAATTTFGPSSRVRYAAAPAASVSAMRLGSQRERPRDHPCARGDGAEAPDELGSAHALHAEVDHDDVGAGPGGGFHRAEGVGRDLDLEVGGLPEHVVLEASDLVGRVAQEHVRGHLLGISAPQRG